MSRKVGGAGQGPRGYFVLRKVRSELHKVAAELGMCRRVGSQHQLMASLMLLELQLGAPKGKGGEKPLLDHPCVPG